MTVISRRLLVSGGVTLLVAALLIAAAADFLVEIWWHASQDMLLYYLLRTAYRDIIAVLITFAQGSLIFLNFILVPALLRFKPRQLFVNSPALQRLSIVMLTPSVKLFAVSAVIFTIPILTPIYLHWEDFLLFFFNAGSILKDPVFNQDISFYLFTLPLMILLQNSMLAVFSLLFATIATAYWLSHRQLEGVNKPLPTGVKIHLTLLILVVIAIQGWAITMEQFEVLYVDRHEPVYFGPGFVEMTYQLPLIWLNFLFFLVAALTLAVYLYTRRGFRLMSICAGLYIAMVAIKQTQWVPALIDRYYVAPNPVTTEHRNISYNIEATRQAFGLQQVETIDYPLQNKSEPVDTEAIIEVLKNIPLWDNELLLAGYDQLQAIRPFFGFKAVAVDRYPIDGRNFQVNVAAREIRPDKLPAVARTWNNRHFVYTHGYGMVMTPSLQQANRPMQWLVEGLNNLTDYDQLRIGRPEIFYGLADYEYAITPNDARPPQPKDGKFQMRSDLVVNGGVAVSSLFQRVMLALYFQDFNLLLTTNMTDRSRLLFRRNIFEQIRSLAPFLTIDANPYPVVFGKKIYWIVDAYTTSDRYPVVRQYQFPLQGGENARQLNYIRNSVKIIIDAYNGAVSFYLIDPQDPVAATYRNIYPTLFKDASELPEEVINHLSYPGQLFTLQMQVYARYHQTDPSIYYQQSEAMKYPEIDGNKVLPYFLTLAPGVGVSQANPDMYRFLLIAPLAQIGRDNLSMIAMAGCIKASDCQTSYSADIISYRFPIREQIEGPAQMTGFINQDPEISRQMTLWQQRGSEVIRGRMIIVPVAGRVLYIQPVYTKAKRSTGFPQLTRIIVAMNQVAAMDSSIESAFEKLQGKIGR